MFVPANMRAIVYDDYGDADQLHSQTLATPTRAPGTVLIRVHAASINPIDVRLRRGEAKWILPGGFPRVPGYDVAGVIAEGDPQAGLHPGDRVLGFLENIYGGGYAQYARCAVSGVAKIPEDMGFEQAAALPLAGTTALQSLRDKGSIKPGDRVLINGASGGVGALAVQVAKSLGAYVAGVASGKHEAFVRSLGADAFIDYEERRFTELGRGWQVIFDVAGTSSYWNARHVLMQDGRYVSLEPNLQGFASSLAANLLPQHGYVVLVHPCASDLVDLINLYQSGQLQVTLADVLPLEQAPRRTAGWKLEDTAESMC